MAEPTVQHMSLEAFLDWEGEFDVRYELHGGVPVAMAPTDTAHQAMAGQLAWRLGDALRARPGCRVFIEAGIRSRLRDDAFFIADLAVACTAPAPGQKMVIDPILIIEILSPSTEATDRRLKLPDYRAMPSVQEILLIDPERPYAEVHRRFGVDRWLTDLLRGSEEAMRLDSVPLSLPLGTLYDVAA
jgi:Uma2 family endonuclease